MSFFKFDIRLDRTFIGISNYLSILKDPVFWSSLKNTLLFTAGSVIGHLTLGMLIALLLNEEVRGKKFWRLIMLVPWMFSGVVTGIMWRWIFNSQFGLINELLLRVGIIDEAINWLSSQRSGYAQCYLYEYLERHTLCNDNDTRLSSGNTKRGI